MTSSNSRAIKLPKPFRNMTAEDWRILRLKRRIRQLGREGVEPPSSAVMARFGNVVERSQS